MLQRCAILAGASPNVFCRVVQKLFKCLAPMVEEGDLFNMETEILEGARKDAVAPFTSERGLLTPPRVEEPTSTPVPNPPPTSKLEGAASPEELALVPRRQPLQPPGLLLGAQITPKYHLWKMHTGLWLCPWEPWWISPPWGHYRWLYCISWSTTTPRPETLPGCPCQVLLYRNHLSPL